MADRCERIRVIGVGNEFREDDAAGIRVLKRLRELVPAGVDFLERSGEGAELMAAWEDADTVLLCDSVSSSEAPGTVLRIDVRDGGIPKATLPCSSHAFGVTEAVEMARALGSLPARLVVYGIVGKRFGAGTDVSPEVESGIAEAVRRIAEEISRVRKESDR